MIARQAVDEGWSVRLVEEAAREQVEESPAPRRQRQVRPAAIIELEERLTERLGTGVSIRPRGEGGRLVIPVEDGWRGEKPLHLHTLSTVSGSWWSGPDDDRGIPTTVQRDGTPNGFRIMSTGVPSSRNGISSTGTTCEITPLLP